MMSKRKILGVLMVALKLTLKALELQSKKKVLGVLIVVLKCTLDIVELQIQSKKKGHFFGRSCRRHLKYMHNFLSCGL